MGELRGFTLLELMIVLALMALAAAMVAPRTLETWRDASTRKDVRGMLQSLPSKARDSGRKWYIGEGAGLPPDLLVLPDGIDLRTERPWTIHPDGRCESTTAALTIELRAYRIGIEGPYCRVSWLDD